MKNKTFFYTFSISSELDHKGANQQGFITLGFTDNKNEPSVDDVFEKIKFVFSLLFGEGKTYVSDR